MIRPNFVTRPRTHVTTFLDGHDGLHEEIQKKFIEKKEQVFTRGKATELQHYLNLILSLTNSSKTPFDYIEHSMFQQNLLQAGLVPNQLFNKFDKKYSGDTTEIGDWLEENLAKIIDTLSKQSGSQIGKKRISSRNFGNNLTEIEKIPYGLFEAFDAQGVKLFTACGKDELKRLSGKYKNKIANYRLGGVQGKIDVQGLKGDIVFNFETSPEFNRLIELLRGANISAKNYTDITSIHIGHSNYYRAIMTILDYFGGLGNITNTNKVYYASNAVIESHRQHIQLAYDLVGAGQMYRDINGNLQSLGSVDYLIIFDKNKSYIHVVSTGHIMSELFKKAGYKFSDTINILKYK